MNDYQDLVYLAQVPESEEQLPQDAESIENQPTEEPVDVPTDFPSSNVEADEEELTQESIIVTVENLPKTPNPWVTNSISLLVAVLGIYLGNLAIRRFILDPREKKQSSILFISTINSQVRGLAFINKRLILKELKQYLKEIDIYKSRLEDDRSYEVAYKQVGIFPENEIDILAEYSAWLKECLCYIKRLLLKLDSSSDPKYMFRIVKVEVVATILLGYFCVYQLSLKYLKKNKKEEAKRFAKDFENNFLEVDANLFMNLCPMDRDLYNGFFKKVIYIRDKYESNRYIGKEYRIYYICRREMSLEKIEKALDSHLPNLIQKAIGENKGFVAISTSKDEAQTLCMQRFRSYLADKLGCAPDELPEKLFNLVFDKSEYKVDIISPWG